MQGYSALALACDVNRLPPFAERLRIVKNQTTSHTCRPRVFAMAPAQSHFWRLSLKQIIAAIVSTAPQFLHRDEEKSVPYRCVERRVRKMACHRSNYDIRGSYAHTLRASNEPAHRSSTKSFQGVDFRADFINMISPSMAVCRIYAAQASTLEKARNLPVKISSSLARTRCDLGPTNITSSATSRAARYASRYFPLGFPA